jgi:CxxC motif-containing protein (DUF1111 family)/predicted lipoprotein with Yx(FWY)xxD motif
MSRFNNFALIGLYLVSLSGLSLNAVAAGGHGSPDGSVSPYSWDMDANGEADALTDGLLMLRYSFGLSGDALTSGAIASDAPLSSSEVVTRLDTMMAIADIDDSGAVDALTDGLLLLRYLFGLSGETLINSAVSSEANRASVADIGAYLEAHMPSQGTIAPDSDNDGEPDASDAFPNDASETADADNDGVGDNSDAFPNDASETADADNDGVGDNSDAFPNDASETADADNDGVGDNADAFSNDPNETEDLNNNGIGDNADANASTAPLSDYCASPLFHLGIDGETQSKVDLTIENVGNNTVKVSITSSDSSEVDALIIEGGSGASMVDDTGVSSGTYAKLLSWSNAMPENTTLTILWSKTSSGGNWIKRDIPVETAATCSGMAAGTGNNSGNTGDTGSNTDSNYQNLSLTNGQIKVIASSYSSVNGQVQKEDTLDAGGGQNVGYIDANDTLIYNLNIPTAGEYIVHYRVASQGGSNPGFELYLNNVLKDTIIVGATGGWQTWTTLEGSSINLPQGNHEIRLKAPVGSLNINWFSFRNDDYVAGNDNTGGTGTGNGDTSGSYQSPSVIIDEVNVSYVALSGDDQQPMLVGGAGSSQPGYALYVFDSDTVNGATSNCNGGCANAWPPLLVTDDMPSGALGLDSITRDDNSEQVTYQGRPLYFYINDTAVGQFNGDNAPGWHSVVYQEVGDLQMLYGANTELEPSTSFVTNDGVIVTRFADRGRDRHAKEPKLNFNYDHYLAHYWQYRTMRVQFEDYVPAGQSLLKATWITESALSAREFRAWYAGETTEGQFHLNNTNAVYHGSGEWNNNFERVGDGDQHKYTVNITAKHLGASQTEVLQAGMNMEFEISMFLAAPPAGARKNYYATSFVYKIGEPGLHPFKWDVGQKDGTPIAQRGRSGGGTTLGYNYTAEPAGRFMQMATNMAPGNANSFVLGRRVHHTSFLSGIHGERHDNPVWTEHQYKSGTHYINESCAGCHVRNGRALVADVGGSLDKWVFKVGDASGNPMSSIGSVLQPAKVGNVTSEGSVTLGPWTNISQGEFAGLRSPNYQFTNVSPPQFSARIAPSLVGMGLLEAVDEATILSWVDESDENADGISGRASMVADPETGETRLGRFGYKAATFSVKHQVASAFNTDMGVMTSMIPNPDCGSQQASCGNSGSEIADEHVNNLVKYVSLLGVGARRDYGNQTGETIFEDIGCAGCHRPSMVTSNSHPLAELRGQTIYPYTDLLLHDMGEGLADNLAEGDASGAEWRTAPLWGLGLTENVMLGDAKGNDLVSQARDYPADLNRIGYLHDGRARTIDEAIRWHGGEAQASKVAYEGLSDTQRNAVLDFLESL